MATWAATRCAGLCLPSSDFYISKWFTMTERVKLRIDEAVSSISSITQTLAFLFWATQAFRESLHAYWIWIADVHYGAADGAAWCWSGRR